ncbi:serine/threonine-protein kinase [Polyangium sp. 15x6]|uniref:serine/threonine-protein kinase n=1 Tax=Polyangium sp. 15x6 TaxID=3042687 RepID=UPI002499C01C|nr:serine/threonine-protein kinase [Polyangium sp. 15x6]MDI3291521.1 serine/threonine-protein kinase [Polyangium sp. 15x6]
MQRDPVYACPASSFVGSWIGRMSAPPRPSSPAVAPAAPAPLRASSSGAPAPAEPAAAAPEAEWEVELGATLAGGFAAPPVPEPPPAAAPAAAAAPAPAPAAPTSNPPPLPSPSRTSAPALPFIAPPPPPPPAAVASGRISSPGGVAPSMSGELRRSSSPSFPGSPPQSPDAMRRSGSGLPAVVPPGHDLRRSSSGLVAVTPNMLEPQRRSSPGLGPQADGVSTPVAYAPGDLIGGKYQLQRVLGQGGMGAVWVARNLSLDADIALKLIRRDRATEEAAARLLTEARAAAKLGHPGIVRVFDFGQTEVGDPYLVMELLTGESLSGILARKKRLDPGVALQTLLPVAAALAAAHLKGIVHRDLKPDNVMLTTDESGKIVPKLLDFGIARVLRDDVERHVTIAGEVLGSPDYMSPEQARGEANIDHRTDVWTYSVLLYETITGRRPFDAPNYNALIAAIVANTPMPTHAYGTGDAALWAIIERGLAKERGTRWQSLRDMGVALAGWALERGIQQDISGLSLQSEWLAPKMRRLLTVQPADVAGFAAARAAAMATAPPVAPPPVTPSAPALALPGIVRDANDAAERKNMRGSSNRKVLFAIGALVALVAAFFVVRALLPNPTTPTGVPAAQTEAQPAPLPAPTPAPTPSSTTVAPDVPEARPTATATTKTTPAPMRTTQTQKKAPPVPKNIQF